MSTFVEPIHIQLPHKRRNIGMLEVLTVENKQMISMSMSWHKTYARTFEKSAEGDMTKLSLDGDHDIKCRIVWSSSILHETLAQLDHFPRAS